jgi:hypothetical protein
MSAIFLWEYKNTDLNRLNTLIHDYDWQSITNDNYPVDLATNIFSKKFLFLYGYVFLKKTPVTIRPNDKPWFDSILGKTIHTRDRLHQKVLKSKKEEHWAEYRKVRNKVNNMEKHAILNYHSNIETHLKDC